MAYISYGAKAFAQNLTYRSEVWLRTLGNFVMVFIQISIWRAVLGEGSVNGINLDIMITYTIINILIFSILLTGVYGEVDGALKSGSISLQLIKPIYYPFFLLFNNLGNVVYQLIFTVFPTFIICWLFFGFSPPASTIHGMAFILSLIMAMILSFLIGYLVALVAFWFMTTFALEWSLSALTIVFSGSFLPLWFFPDFWFKVANALPFPYMGFIPAAIYMGEIASEDVGRTFLIGFAWILAIFIMVTFLWKRALKRLIIQGG